MNDKKRLVEVCDECGRSCCWHGEHMCNESAWAGITRKTVEELDASALEHEYYYSKEVIKEVYGEEAPHGYAD